MTALQRLELRGRVDGRRVPRLAPLRQRHRLERPIVRPVENGGRAVDIHAADADHPASDAGDDVEQRLRLRAGAEDPTSGANARSWRAWVGICCRSPTIEVTPRGSAPARRPRWNTATACPASPSARTTCGPMKPVPPMTKMRIALGPTIT